MSPASPALAGEFFTAEQPGRPACLSVILHVGLGSILSIFCKRFAKGHVRFVSRFILLHLGVQLIQHHLLKRLSLLHCIAFALLSKISWLYFLKN